MAQTTTSMTPADTKKLLAALEANWQAEMEGYYTYAAFAKNETDPQRRNTLRGLVRGRANTTPIFGPAASRHSAHPHPNTPATPPGRPTRWPTGQAAVDLALRRLESTKAATSPSTESRSKSLGDQPASPSSRRCSPTKRDHYITLGDLIRHRCPLPAMPPEHRPGRRSTNLVAARDKGQPKAASWIGDAIYGVNDGLGAIFGIVSGVSGATLGNSPLRPHRRPRRNGRQRPLHGLRRLPRRQERARDLRGRVRPRARSRRSTTKPKPANSSPSPTRSAASPPKTPTTSSIRSPRTRKNSSKPSPASASTPQKKA